MVRVLAATGVLVAWLVNDIRCAWRDNRLTPCVENECGPAHDVSVLIPARNEAARIGACLAGLARQNARPGEVIVVDDHSTDATVAVVGQYAGRLAGLRVLPSRALPPAWGGKNWGCWQAAGVAAGAWLLFLDADVAPEPALIATLLAYARRERIDMLSVLPRIEMHSLAEQLVLPAFFSLVMRIYPFAQVNRPDTALAFAIGQVVLIRRDCYFAIGGHATMRASVLEDMELAAAVKRAGFRLAAAYAPALVSVRMYDGWASLLEGLSKNAEAGAGNAGRRALPAALRQALAVWAPIDILAYGMWRASAGQRDAVWLVWLGSGLAGISTLVWGWLLQRRLGAPRRLGALLPLGTLVYFLIAAYAALRVRAGRALRWKERELHRSA